MRKRKNIKKRKNYGTIWMINLCLILVGTAIFVWYINVPNASPEETLKEYMSYISNQKYEQMYEMIDVGASGNICQEDFMKRNSAIYEGIGVDNIKIHITSYDKEQKEICYETSMDTVAGNVTFENNVSFIQEKGTYKLVWSDSLIFPELDSTDKVKVSVTNADRGQILDRNGRVLAGKGVASSVGVVPGKLENRDDAISQLETGRQRSKQRREPAGCFAGFKRIARSVEEPGCRSSFRRKQNFQNRRMRSECR